MDDYTATHRHSVESSQDVALRTIRLDESEYDGQYIYRATKRTFDFLASLAGLILLSPVYLIVALAVKLESKGPIFFSQIRIGKDGAPFRMYKFRSMQINAEAQLEDLLKKNEATGAMFKIKDDPRITRVGKFIRHTSLDELPQLWNVVNGSMSLVGPRPCLPSEYEAYSEYDKQREYVKPGCTGLWQVSGRSAVGFNEMVELDLSYIQNRSILHDLEILFRTVKVVFKPNSAY